MEPSITILRTLKLNPAESQAQRSRGPSCNVNIAEDNLIIKSDFT